MTSKQALLLELKKLYQNYKAYIIPFIAAAIAAVSISSMMFAAYATEFSVEDPMASGLFVTMRAVFELSIKHAILWWTATGIGTFLVFILTDLLYKKAYVSEWFDYKKGKEQPTDK